MINPKGLKKDQYDVIIIGAGIGGLVCGCYLAKAGMKVLIVEKNDKPGGYCTSFKRNKFTFNVITSSLGNLGEDKELGKIVEELNLSLKFIRTNPSDVIYTPDYRIPIYNDFNQTIINLQDKFPYEAKSIKDFFDFIKLKDTISLYSQLRNKTFTDVLNQYFKNFKLKSILAMIPWRLGIGASSIAAFTAAIHYREFIFDLGYHPVGGMQIFSTALAEKFKKLGGDFLLSCSVNKIMIKNKKVYGIIIKKKNFIQSKFVIAACDPTQIFLDLIGEDYLEKKFVNRLKNLTPSPSAFTLYLGVDTNLKDTVPQTYVLCYNSNYKIDNYNPKDTTQLEKKYLDVPLHLTFPSFYDSSLAPTHKESLSLTIFAPFINEQYWREKKLEIIDKLIIKAEEIIRNISENIIIKETVTPFTLYKYTLNKEGSVHGWASLPSQLDPLIIRQKSFIEGLYLSGQWITLPTGESGLPMAAYTGKSTARLILKREKNKR